MTTTIPKTMRRPQYPLLRLRHLLESPSTTIVPTSAVLRRLLLKLRAIAPLQHRPRKTPRRRVVAAAVKVVLDDLPKKYCEGGMGRFML
jgi:hypothetical protein